MTTDTKEIHVGLFSRLAASGAHQKLLAFASLVILLLGFSLASPNFMQVSNIIAILQATSVNGVLAIAATLVTITGGIDLSVGTLMTFTAVMTGVVLTKLALPLPLGIITAIASGAFCGFCSGGFVAKMKIPPFIRNLRAPMKYLRYGPVDRNPLLCLKGGDTLRLGTERSGEQSQHVLAAVQ